MARDPDAIIRSVGAAGGGLAPLTSWFPYSSNPADQLPGTPLADFPVGQGLNATGNDKPRKLSKGTIWELVASHWRKHGMDQVAIGTAIVLAESGGRTNARHKNTDGSVDRGMWQINSRAHPDVSDACADDSVCATAAAYKIYVAAGNSWKPWSTFNSGAYQKFVGDVTIQDASAIPQGIGGPGCGPLPDSFCSFVKGFTVLFDREFWIRVLKIMAGLVAVGVAVVMIAKEYLPSIPLPIPEV